MLLPVTPAILLTLLSTTLPFWTYLRRISVRVPESVPSSVTNWVMTVNLDLVSMVLPGP